VNEFSCNNECDNAECCRFFIVETLAPLDYKIDNKFCELHEIEVIEKQISTVIKMVYFKIPIECKWLKDNKCSDYENRPEACKLHGGGTTDNPFKIAKCPFLY